MNDFYEKIIYLAVPTKETKYVLLNPHGDVKIILTSIVLSFVTPIFVAMVWKVYEGMRYFEECTEYEIKRFQRIYQNWEKMVEVGLLSADSHFYNYRPSSWTKDKERLQRCKLSQLSTVKTNV